MRPLIITIAFVVCFVGSEALASVFQTEVVAQSNLIPFRSNSVGIGLDGAIGVVYSQGGSVSYAHRIAGMWGASQILSEAGSIFVSDLRYDSGGTPHFVFFNSLTNTSVMYGTRSGASWTFEVVGTGGNLSHGGVPSLAIRQDGTPVVAWSDGNELIRLSTRSGAGWTHETIQNIRGRCPSLQVDELDNPRIAYFKTSENKGLALLSKSASGWQNSIIMETQADIVFQPALSLTPGGEPRIAFAEKNLANGSGLIRYAVPQGLGWLLEDVGPIASAFSQSAPGFDVDFGGTPQVAYLGSHSTLTYALRDSSGWRTFDLESSSDTGYYADLVTDANGRTHLTYSDSPLVSYTLRYARIYWGAPQWGVDGGGSWGDAEHWNGILPDKAGAEADFRTSLVTASSAPGIIVLDGNRTVGALTFDNATTDGINPNSFIIAPGTGGSLRIENNGPAGVNVVSGTHTIAVPIIMADSTTVDIAPASTLYTTGGISVNDGKSLRKTNAGRLDISGGLKLGAGSSLMAEAGGITVDSIRGGSLAIRRGAMVAIKPAGGSVNRISGLSFDGTADAWEGTLDLADSSLIVQATPETRDQVLQDITNQMRTGRKNGAWTGNGIRSSAAQVNSFTGLAVLLNYKYGSTKPLLEMFSEESVDNSCILIKYTWNGDGNLDGVVNADDYFLIDTGFVTQTGGYHNGDFNYDGLINADDYFLIDSAYIGQSGKLSAGIRPNAVPEPNVLAVAVFAALGLGTWRVRRQGR
jgi:hypothetical protein